MFSLEVEENSGAEDGGMKAEGTSTSGGEKGWSLVSASSMHFTLKNKNKRAFTKRE